jgi:glucose-6-phosphate 1-dehydrogenase
VQDKFRRIYGEVLTNSGQLGVEFLYTAIDRMFQEFEAVEPFLIVGEAVRGGGLKGHRKKYGADEEKRRRWAEYQAEVDRMHELYPRLSYERLEIKAAEKFRVCRETIKRHTTNPRRKK